jgi:hypothetical protein
MNSETLTAQCEHRYLTSYGKGWVCANPACGVGILSLSVPIPMPLVEKALRVIAGMNSGAQTNDGEQKGGA